MHYTKKPEGTPTKCACERGKGRQVFQKQKPVVLDLFCGAGGLSLGFEMAGYSIGLGVEKEELPWQTHRYNFGGRCHLGNISDISNPGFFIQEHGLEQVDVIIGGPPCQGFSRVGRGKIRSLLRDPVYIHDPRNQHYKDFIRFVEALQPFYFVMENVPDMQYYADEGGLLLEKALRRFQKAGYTVDWRVLQADHYGVPQTRRRLFVIGNRLGQGILWPEKTHEDSPVTVWQAISDLPVVCHGHRQDEMPYRPRCKLNDYQRLMRQGADTVLYNHQTRWHNLQDLEAFTWLPEGGKYVDLPGCYKRYRDDIFKDKYWKLFRDRPSWTIEAHIGKDTYRHIYPSRMSEPEPPRTISVREAARLQSFPDRFRFFGPFTRQFYQVGNAVPPLLAKAVAEAILPGVRTGMAAKREALRPCRMRSAERR
jgi:DNA (cytosine-5)-methyltransferase 1